MGLRSQTDLKAAAATLGRKGGASGKGESKKRSKAHYKRISALGVEARLKKLKQKEDQ